MAEKEPVVETKQKAAAVEAQPALLVIPEPPWTYDALGPELYAALARAYCGLNPTDPGFRPALDLTDAYRAQNQLSVKKG